MFLFPDPALRARPARSATGRLRNWYPETATIITENGKRME
jgi:hypothetical protein